MFVILGSNNLQVVNADEAEHCPQMWIEVIKSFISTAGTVTAISTRDDCNHSFVVNERCICRFSVVWIEQECPAYTHNLMM